MQIPDEIRLAGAIALNAAVLFAAWRFARRWTADRLQAAVDAGLLFYLVQYAVIGVLGLAGALHPWTIAAMAMVVSVLLVIASGKSVRDGSVELSPPSLPGASSVWGEGTSIFIAMTAITFVGAYVHFQRLLPVMSNDAMTYHLPAAVQWLQEGKIGRFDAWLFNPANTFSPLAGSMFAAWLIAPMGDDLLARCVELPALILTGMAVLQICRAAGAGVGVATILAAAVVVSRPFLSQAMWAKDDLFVAAFFAIAVGAMSRPRWSESIGPWRLGAAVGLLLATKYTTLFSVPLLLIGVDALRGRGVRGIAVAAGVAVLLAGPWYLRNYWWTGNPLFPADVGSVFTGLFAPGHSERLQTLGGVMAVLTGGTYGLPATLDVGASIWIGPAVLVAVGWVAAVVGGFKSVVKDPIVRIAVIGPVVGVVWFAVRSPYPEIRFVFPSLMLMFVTAGVAIVRWAPGAAWQVAAGAVVLVSSMFTTLVSGFLQEMLVFAVVGVVVATAGIGLTVLQRYVLRLRWPGVTLTVVVGLVVSLFAYVYWPAYVIEVRLRAAGNWQAVYGEEALAWQFVRDELPADASIAYANTYFVYPLYGADLSRRVVYAPVNAKLTSFLQLPRLGDTLSGEQLSTAVAKATTADPSREVWINRLTGSGAKYLFVSRRDVQVDSVELNFAEADPKSFEKVFDNAAAVVYRIAR